MLKDDRYYLQHMLEKLVAQPPTGEEQA